MEKTFYYTVSTLLKLSANGKGMDWAHKTIKRKLIQELYIMYSAFTVEYEVCLLMQDRHFRTYEIQVQIIDPLKMSFRTADSRLTNAMST